MGSLLADMIDIVANWTWLDCVMDVPGQGRQVEDHMHSVLVLTLGSGRMMAQAVTRLPVGPRMAWQ